MRIRDMYTWLSNLILVCIFGIWAWMCIDQMLFVDIPNQVLAICIALASGNIGTYVADRIPQRLEVIEDDTGN